MVRPLGMGSDPALRLAAKSLGRKGKKSGKKKENLLLEGDSAPNVAPSLSESIIGQVINPNDPSVFQNALTQMTQQGNANLGMIGNEPLSPNMTSSDFLNNPMFQGLLTQAQGRQSMLDNMAQQLPSAAPKGNFVWQPDPTRRLNIMGTGTSSPVLNPQVARDMRRAEAIQNLLLTNNMSAGLTSPMGGGVPSKGRGGGIISELLGIPSSEEQTYEKMTLMQKRNDLLNPVGAAIRKGITSDLEQGVTPKDRRTMVNSALMEGRLKNQKIKSDIRNTDTDTKKKGYEMRKISAEIGDIYRRSDSNTQEMIAKQLDIEKKQLDLFYAKNPDKDPSYNTPDAKLKRQLMENQMERMYYENERDKAEANTYNLVNPLIQQRLQGAVQQSFQDPNVSMTPPVSESAANSYDPRLRQDGLTAAPLTGYGMAQQGMSSPSTGVATGGFSLPEAQGGGPLSALWNLFTSPTGVKDTISPVTDASTRFGEQQTYDNFQDNSLQNFLNDPLTQLAFKGVSPRMVPKDIEEQASKLGQPSKEDRLRFPGTASIDPMSILDWLDKKNAPVDYSKDPEVQNRAYATRYKYGKLRGANSKDPRERAAATERAKLLTSDQATSMARYDSILPEYLQAVEDLRLYIKKNGVKNTSVLNRNELEQRAARVSMLTIELNNLGTQLPAGKLKIVDDMNGDVLGMMTRLEKSPEIMNRLEYAQATALRRAKSMYASAGYDFDTDSMLKNTKTQHLGKYGDQVSVTIKDNQGNIVKEGYVPESSLDKLRADVASKGGTVE